MDGLGSNDWVIFIILTLIVGVAKTGFSGLSLIPVSIFAAYFGKQSVGVLLPLLILADFTVYPAMRQYGSWKEALVLMPPALIGIGIGLILLGKMPEEWARPVIGVMILLMLGVMLWKRIQPESPLYRSRGFGTFSASLGGISTTLANAAGPVINIYLLSRGFPKMHLVGISARFFLLVNLIKLPLLGGLSLITAETLWLNLKLAPMIIIGVYLGKWLLGKISQRLFDQLVVIFALLAAARLFF